MPIVASSSSSSAWRTTAVSDHSPHGVLGELDHLGVLIVSGEDDDHGLDRLFSALRVVLVDHPVAIRVLAAPAQWPRVADVQDALVLEDRLDACAGPRARDRLESRRASRSGFAAESAVSCRTYLLAETMMSMSRPGLTRKSTPVTRSTWKAIAFSPGSSIAAMSTGATASADRPPGSPGACGTGNSAGWPESCVVLLRGVPLDGVRVDLLLLDLVGSDRIADGDVLRGDQNRDRYRLRTHRRRRWLTG